MGGALEEEEEGEGEGLEEVRPRCWVRSVGKVRLIILSDCTKVILVD